jgi:hypothetical protein
VDRTSKKSNQIKSINQKIMLTKQQKQIIADMSDSFAKVNEQFNTSKSFNLINADELHMLNRKKIEFAENVKIAKENWCKLAEAEVYRIISLLKEDLPNAVIQKQGKENGHYEGNSILIGRRESDLSGHHEKRVTIDVVKLTEKAMEDEYGNWSNIPMGLAYEYWGSNSRERFSDIQSLCSSKVFISQVRNKVL